MVRWATRSLRNTNVFFAAVQMLRDLGTIDQAEAAYLLNELFDDLQWMAMDRQDPDPALARAVVQGVEPDLILAAMHEEELVIAAAWYRERGDEDLADMVLDRPRDHDQLCAEGHFSLIDEKPSREAPAPHAETATSAPRFAERVLALLAAEVAFGVGPDLR